MKYNVNEMEFVSTFEYKSKQSKQSKLSRMATAAFNAMMVAFVAFLIAYSIVMFGTN